MTAAVGTLVGLVVMYAVLEALHHRNTKAWLKSMIEKVMQLEAECNALTVALDADRTEWMTTYETMRAELETLRCGDLGPFYDGELPPDRAAAFREHLARCKVCQADMRVDVLLDDAANRSPR